MLSHSGRVACVCITCMIILIVGVFIALKWHQSKAVKEPVNLIKKKKKKKGKKKKGKEGKKGGAWGKWKSKWKKKSSK